MLYFYSAHHEYFLKYFTIKVSITIKASEVWSRDNLSKVKQRGQQQNFGLLVSVPTLSLVHQQCTEILQQASHFIPETERHHLTLCSHNQFLQCGILASNSALQSQCWQSSYSYTFCRLHLPHCKQKQRLIYDIPQLLTTDMINTFSKAQAKKPILGCIFRWFEKTEQRRH